MEGPGSDREERVPQALADRYRRNSAAGTLLQGVTVDDVEHVAAPVVTREHLRDALTAMGLCQCPGCCPKPNAGLGINIASHLVIEREVLPFSSIRRCCCGQDNVRVLIKQPDAGFEVGLTIEIVVCGPLEQGRRR